MNFRTEEVRGRLQDPLAGDDAVTTGYSIDSRTSAPGDLFFAIRGEHFDGHDFVASALANGATAAVVEREKLAGFAGISRSQLVAVGNTLDALQTLAMAARERWQGTAIGITGSVGKTTTKEAVAQVLSARYRVLKSSGNLNNHFGLPLQLLRLQPDDQYAVLEMGMSSAGEIARLAAIAKPQWGVVNTVAAVHTEFFADGIEGVARAKRELIEALPPDGVAFLNFDDERVRAFAAYAKCPVISFGREDNVAVRAAEVRSLGADGVEFRLVADGETAYVRLHLIGEHNVTNALAAAAVGIQAGLSTQEIAEALGTMRPPDKRGETLHIAGAIVINDCYNSNPRALNAMVDALAQVPAKRRIVVAGEMLELGPGADAMHAACGEHIADRGMDIVIGVRGLACAIVDAAARRGLEAHFFPTPEEAGDWLSANLQQADAVLLKASRGVRLERALDRLQQ